jgi:hypothetical protein
MNQTTKEKTGEKPYPSVPIEQIYGNSPHNGTIQPINPICLSDRQDDRDCPISS